MTMNDHAPKLRAKHQQEADERSIIEMEQQVMPLMLAIKITLVGLALAIAWHYLGEHIRLYLAMGVAQEALVQCLNGAYIGIDDDIMVSCRTRSLMPTLAEVQP